MLKHTTLLKALLTVTLLCSATNVFAFDFAPGNIYGTYPTRAVINEYDSLGNHISSLTPAVDPDIPKVWLLARMDCCM